MKIFLSSLENRTYKNKDGVRENFAHYLIDNGIELKYNLMSYYYLRTKLKDAEFIRDNSKEVIIDSGAHSFQFGKKVDFIQYTKEYAEFIKKFDRDNVVGYFEMDIDNIIGYEEVKKLRKILEQDCDKIIPVWHYNRGIDDYKKMCRDYEGRVIAITGFANKDIRDEQYISFMKLAKEHNCKVHCLGMTRKKILDKVPFDFVDSSSWIQEVLYGKLHGTKNKIKRGIKGQQQDCVFAKNYEIWQNVGERYYQKWKKVCKD